MTKVHITYNPNGSLKWSQRQRDIIKAKFNRGRTQIQIADEVTEEWGVKITKGMVVGQLNHMGIHRPPRGLDPAQQGGGYQKKPKRKYIGTTLFQGGVVEDHLGIGTIERSLETFFTARNLASPPIPFAKTTARTCKWPYDDKGVTVYCGCRVREGKVYCEPHYMLARATNLTMEQKREIVHELFAPA